MSNAKRQLRNNVRAKLVGLFILIVIIVSFVVATLISIRRHNMVVGSLENVTSFQRTELDRCVIVKGVNPHHQEDEYVTDRRKVIPKEQLNEFASKFAHLMKAHSTSVTYEVFEFIFFYNIKFSAGEKDWKFQFGHVPHEGYIEFDACEPSIRGTIMIDKEGAGKLERLLNESLKDR